MLKQNTNAPRKRQEAMPVSKGRGSHVYPISNFAGQEDMVLVTFSLREWRVRQHHRRSF
jgi:hypothetical protein